jgi:hypothetical protein
MILTFLLTMIMASGCATKKVESERLVEEELPRPAEILVYDFAATPAEVPADSVVTREIPVDTTASQTAEDCAVGQDLGFQIATQLAAHLRETGLPAKRVAIGTRPPTDTNVMVIRGYLISVREGSAARRVIIGFGSGTSELNAAAEVFQATEDGLRKLKSIRGQFGGRRGTGTALGAVGFAATANPLGLIVSGGTSLYGEVRGSSRIQARAQTAAREIGRVLETRARELGWIG